MRTSEKAILEYTRWLENTKDDRKMQKALESIEENLAEIEDAFYKGLTFGTSGIRGIIGPGTNRINRYVVSRTTQGLSDYLNEHFEEPSVVIAYDSRKYSKEFAEVTAGILSGNGIEAILFPEITPVPVLSYAIRKLECTMGVMITASHNPSIFNGYKVYNSEGYQIVGNVPGAIMEKIESCDYFDDVPFSDENIEILDDTLKNEFLDDVQEMMPVTLDKDTLNDIRIVYTPLNGTGGPYVTELFRRMGFTQVITVPSQEWPDEEFTTCPVPNPEKLTAYNEGFKVLDNEKADIVIATDPDSDRTGAAIVHNGMKTDISGNKLGILMVDFLCRFRETGENRFIMKSIVSSPLAEKIALAYGIETRNTLTGFKYIGEQISRLGETGDEERFFMGFEESNGFLINPFIRDKDGISSAVMIAVMAAYYKKQGMDLLDRVDQLYMEYGHCVDKTRNYVFEGIEGAETMERIMEYFRCNVHGNLGGINIVSKTDYLMEETGFPPANVIKLVFEDGTHAIIRPSGTEPKIKVYMFLSEEGSEAEKSVEAVIKGF